MRNNDGSHAQPGDGAEARPANKMNLAELLTQYQWQIDLLEGARRPVFIGTHIRRITARLIVDVRPQTGRYSCGNRRRNGCEMITIGGESRIAIYLILH